MTVSKTRRSVLSSCRARSLAPTLRSSLLVASSGARGLPHPASAHSGRPTPPPGCVCKQGSVAGVCWRGDEREGRVRPSRRRVGPETEGVSGSLSPALSPQAPSSGHRADPGQPSALRPGPPPPEMFKCRHFAWWQTNFFVTFFPAHILLSSEFVTLLRPVWKSPHPCARPHCSGAASPPRGLVARPTWCRGDRACGWPQPPPPQAGPGRLGLLPSLCALFCVLESSPTPAHTRARSSPFSPWRPGLISLSVKWAQLFALGRGLARASQMRLWNASSKGMGLHTGPASMAANASWEVPQDQGLESGQGPPESPGGRNVLGQGLFALARWFLSLGTSQGI